ncbi:MAG: tetratricopeptide repeat protein [bacterium]|nr:tetratricopeptide repeat protein [bacterium]
MNSILQKLRTVYEARPTLFAVLLITAALTIFYSNSFTADWHYDDFHHIKENINIRKISNIPMFFTDATTFSRNPQTRMYRPLLMATHAINYQVGIWTNRDGYDVVGYHVVNFLFHLVSSLLVFFITLFLFRRRIRLDGMDPALPAAFAGLLFGLQTINTETIVYISSRSSGMATMFLLAGFYFYLKATQDQETTSIRFLPLALSTFMYLCGFLSKEIAVTLPGMIFLYEIFLNRRWMEGRSLPAIMTNLTIRLAPYGVVLVGILYTRLQIYGENLASRFTEKGGTQAAADWVSQLATQSRAVVFYIREWFLPTGLSIDKPFQVTRSFSDGKVLLSCLVITLIVAAALRYWKKHPLITFGVLWFFLALLPTSLFRLNVVINDHRLYLPGFGFVLVFTYVVAKLYLRFRSDGGWYFKTFITICLTILLFMGLGTFKRNMAFATEETIWKDVILKDRNSVRGYNNLGIYYEQNGDFDRALQHYQRTIKLAPMFPNPYINVGNVYHKKKGYENAEKWMKRAIQLDPKSALANYNLGNILREAGKTEEAIGAYKTALKYNPRYIEAANNLANIYFKERKYPEAIQYYKQALFIDPTFAMSYYNIALAYENLGQPAVAIANYEKFLRFWLGDRRYISLASSKMQALQKQLGGPQGN